ncbi:MAG TPA: YciI family protein [Mycobacteriales bacterium]|nr:YciI family protein [Mycobacteriales bacterium]
MKQYLMTVHLVDGQPPHDPAATQQVYADVDAFNQRLQDEGRWVFAGGLYPPDVATVVRTAGGEVTTTDGPFAEGKEHVGGFWVITAEDLDTALALATDASRACHGPVEVRPFQDMPEAE